MSLPPRHASSLSPEERILEQQTFAIAFESLLEALSDATTFSAFCLTYKDPFGRPLSTARFRTWIFAIPARKTAYYTAKSMAAEAIEDDLIRIADGLNPDGSLSPNDPARSKLMVDVRFKLLPVYNRDRYAPTTQVDINTTVTTKNVDSISTQELKRLILEKRGYSPDSLQQPVLTVVPLTPTPAHAPEMDGMDPGEDDTPDLPADPLPDDPPDD